MEMICCETWLLGGGFGSHSWRVFRTEKLQRDFTRTWPKGFRSEVQLLLLHLGRSITRTMCENEKVLTNGARTS